MGKIQIQYNFINNQLVFVFIFVVIFVKFGEMYSHSSHALRISIAQPNANIRKLMLMNFIIGYSRRQTRIFPSPFEPAAIAIVGPVPGRK
jgi:hypothetical protein